MKYFIYAGWDPHENREVYFHLGDDSQYTSWQGRFENATIFKNEYYLFTDLVESEAENDGIVDIKRIEVKLGEWENV